MSYALVMVKHPQARPLLRFHNDSSTPKPLPSPSSAVSWKHFKVELILSGLQPPSSKSGSQILQQPRQTQQPNCLRNTSVPTLHITLTFHMKIRSHRLPSPTPNFRVTGSVPKASSASADNGNGPKNPSLTIQRRAQTITQLKTNFSPSLTASQRPS